MPATPPMRLVDALRGEAPTLLRQLVDAAPPGAVNLGLGQPVAQVAQVLRRAAAQAAEAPYSPNPGAPAARAAVAAAYGRPASDALITVGAQQALMLALCGLLQAGDEVLVPDPGFPVYEKIARWAGASPVRYPLRASQGFQPDPDEVARLITPRTRLMVINTPGNPTGVCWRRDRLQAVLDALARHGVPYLSDEVYSALAFDPTTGALLSAPPPLPSALAPDAGLTASSLSKSHALMGWRLGWLTGPADTIRGLIPLHQLQVTCAPMPAQAAAVAAFSPEGQAASTALAQEIARRRLQTLDTLRALLPACLPCPSDGALYLFLSIADIAPPDLAHPDLGGDDLALCHRLLSHGVILIPGRAFGAGGQGFIRLAFGVAPSDLTEGLRRFAAALSPDAV
jgi:aspartate aminotransferase